MEPSPYTEENISVWTFILDFLLFLLGRLMLVIGFSALVLWLYALFVCHVISIRMVLISSFGRNVLGIIDLDQIKEVHWLGDPKENGTRFSLIMANGRSYDFRASTRRTAVTWVGQLQDLLQSFGRDVKPPSTSLPQRVTFEETTFRINT